MRKVGIYERFIKRSLDFLLSLTALCVLSPVLVILTVVGAIVMGGNPFFTQQRPGRNEKIFKLIKFRTMTNKKDKSGELLPDEQRLTGYGRFLRSTSLDELGHMSIVGPRPLLVAYLPYYTEEEKHRHDVRPGLTGWAQVNGRNALKWEEKFAYDLEYVENLSFKMDLKVLFTTVKKVLRRSDVISGAELKKVAGRLDHERQGSGVR